MRWYAVTSSLITGSQPSASGTLPDSNYNGMVGDPDGCAITTDAHRAKSRNLAHLLDQQRFRIFEVSLVDTVSQFCSLGGGIRTSSTDM